MAGYKSLLAFWVGGAGIAPTAEGIHDFDSIKFVAQGFIPKVGHSGETPRIASSMSNIFKAVKR